MNNTNKIPENEFTINNILNRKGAESIQILNEIDFLISNAATVPLTSKVMVDAEYLFSLTERFRQVFPKDLAQADMVINDVQNMVRDAEAMAKHVIANAEQQAQAILNESRILKEAQARASFLINEAMMGREQMQKEAEGYVYALFQDAENRLMSNALAVKEAVASMKHLELKGK